VVGMLVMLVGTVPRNIAFAANLRLFPSIPWAVPLVALYLWGFWRYLGGVGPPEGSAAFRRRGLRANRVTGRAWAWALTAGGLGIVALVFALRLANRLVALPQQELPDLSHVPQLTVVGLIVAAAPIAGVVEEVAFRGFMQGPIESRYGLTVAILITGTMFAVAHLDFAPVLWPYYVAVAAVYGTVTHWTDSILPAVVLHTLGNTYSNLDLLLHGTAEWQAATEGSTLVWVSGPDAAFWGTLVVLLAAVSACICAYRRLARVGARAGA